MFRKFLTSSLLLLVFVLFSGEALFGETIKYYRPVKSTGYTFAIWSDSHYSTQPLGLARCDIVLEFLQDYEPKPVFLAITGDLSVGTGITGGTFVAEGDSIEHMWYARRKLDAWSDSSNIPIVPVIGNHEPSYEFTQSEKDAWDAADYPKVPNDIYEESGKSFTDPHRLALLGWSGLMPSEYYTRDFHSVSLLAMNNNVDTLYARLVADGHRYITNAYAMSNPPGIMDTCSVGDTACYPNIINPDYSGFVTPGSDQWLWAIDHLQNSSAIWNIPLFHRAIYSPLGPSGNPDSTAAGRPNIYQARTGIIKDMIDNGAKLFFSGDVHQGAVVGPVYENAVDPSGAYFVTTTSQFSMRSIREQYVPENSLLYPPPEEYGTTQSGAFLAICHVYGKRIHLKLYYFPYCIEDFIPELVFEKGIRI